MVERLIQTIKQKLGVMTIDPLWSSQDISTIVANIIQNIGLIPKRFTRIAQFEARSGKKPSTALSNIVTKPNTHNLSYKQKKLCFRSEITKATSINPSGYVGHGAGLRAGTQHTVQRNN